MHFIDIVKYMYFLYFCSFWHFLVKPPHLCMKPEHMEKRCLTATFDNSFIFVSSIKDLAFILESVVLLKKCYIHFTHRLTVASFRGTTGNKKSTCLKDMGSTIPPPAPPPPTSRMKKFTCTKRFIYFSSRLH